MGGATLAIRVGGLLCPIELWIVCPCQQVSPYRLIAAVVNRHHGATVGGDEGIGVGARVHGLDQRQGVRPPEARGVAS